MVQPSQEFAIYTLVPLNYDKEGGKLGTLFTEVAHALLATEWWKKKTSAKGRFHCLLGEAQGGGVPFQRITAVKDMYGITPLVNFYRSFRTLCRKSMMVQTLRAYCVENDLSFTSIAPESFLFYPSKPEDSEREAFIESFNSETSNLKPNNRGVWILKPSDGGKGKKILVMDDLEKILAHIDEQPKGSIAWVVQRYIERPLLLEGGRKFDIRCWVLLTPDYRIHLYKVGDMTLSLSLFLLLSPSLSLSPLSNCQPRRVCCAPLAQSTPSMTLTIASPTCPITALR